MELINKIKKNTICNPDKYYFLLFFIILSILCYLRYSSIHSGVFDLGVYTSTLFKLSSIGYYESIFIGHVSPYLIFYSLVYLFFSVTGVLTLQSAVIAYTAYFVKKHFGVLTFVVYILYFALWFNALFDFHPDHLSILFLFLFFKSTQNGKIGKASMYAIALALVKEVFALQTIMCGFYLLFYNWRSKNTLIKYLYSIGIITFGLGYFYLTTHYIIPLYSSGNDFVSIYSEAFSYLGSNISEVFKYLFTHPVEILVEITTNQGKLIYLIALFGALGFIPLLKPGPLIVAIPILAISLLSKHEGYYGLGHHYTAGLIAPMIFAFAGGLPRAKIIWHKIGFSTKWFIPLLVTGLVAIHITLAPSPIGRLFWSDKVWAYSYQAYISTDRDDMVKQAITNYIPSDLDVLVSIQNTVNWSPLVQRRHLLLFPSGITEPVFPLEMTERNKFTFFGDSLLLPELEWKPVMADFVVLDMKRPWFLVDKGCDWLYGKCTNDKIANEYLGWVERTKTIMQVVFERDGFIILKRNNSGE